MSNLTIVIEACPGCCLFCHDLWGDVLPCATAGIMPCSVFIILGSPDRCFVATISSGVNGGFDVTWGGSDWRNAHVGVVSVQEVDCETGDPIGDPDTADVLAVVSCSGDNLLVENMGFANPLDGGAPVAVFQNFGAFIDTPASNSLVCPFSPSAVAFGGGSFTAFTP